MRIMPSLDVCHAVIPKKKKKFKSGMWWIIIVLGTRIPDSLPWPCYLPVTEALCSTQK